MLTHLRYWINSAGFWKSQEELKKLHAVDRIFQPQGDANHYTPILRSWERALERSMHWYSKFWWRILMDSEQAHHHLEYCTIYCFFFSSANSHEGTYPFLLLTKIILQPSLSTPGNPVYQILLKALVSWIHYVIIMTVKWLYSIIATLQNGLFYNFNPTWSFNSLLQISSPTVPSSRSLDFLSFVQLPPTFICFSLF